MKKIAIIYFLLISIFSEAQTISAYMDMGKFKVNDTLSFVELYLGIHSNSVKFEKNDDGKFQANILTSVKLFEGDKITYYENFNVKSPESESEKPSFNKFNFSKRIFTNNKVYKCELTIKDQLSEDTAQVVEFEINNSFKYKKIMFSDIQLLESFEQTELKNDFVKAGYLMNPLTSNFYPNSVKTLKYYLEIYNTDIDKSLGENTPFVMFTTFRDKHGKLLNELGSYKRDSTRSTIRLINQIDISKLPSGNYFLVVEIRNKENKLISYTVKEIQRANTDIEEIPDEADANLLANNFTNSISIEKLNYYMECLQPIATETEKSSLYSLKQSGDSTQKRNYFFNFWYKRHKTNAQKEWIKYEKNIKTVDEEFSCHGRPGFLTEQGRIYLQYGAPNRIDTDFTDPGRNAGNMVKEYQVWQYYTLNNGQRNRFFVFMKPNPGNCQFDLIHSNVNGELQNGDWVNTNNWRDILRNYNSPTTPYNSVRDEEISNQF